MLADVLHSASRPGVRVLVDFSTVDFMDSSGVTALLVAAQRARGGGGALVVCSPSPRVRRVFEVLALDGVLPIEDARS